MNARIGARRLVRWLLDNGYAVATSEGRAVGSLPNSCRSFAVLWEDTARDCYLLGLIPCKVRRSILGLLYRCEEGEEKGRWLLEVCGHEMHEEARILTRQMEQQVRLAVRIASISESRQEILEGERRIFESFLLYLCTGRPLWKRSRRLRGSARATLPKGVIKSGAD